MISKLLAYLTGGDQLNIILFKTLGAGGIGISFVSCIYSLFIRDFPGAIVDGLAGFLALLLLHFVNKTGHYIIGYVVVEFAVFMFLFAVLFFEGGGMDGSMPYFFSFALIFTFLMFEGRLLILMESLLSVFYLILCIIAIHFPDLIENPGGRRELLRERMVGIFLPAFSMGMIFLLYIWEYRKQKKIAEEANRAKSIFLANMSHEIRTPIHAVLGFNEMIQRSSKDPQAKEYAGYIQQSGQRLLNVVNEVLEFSRMESGKGKLDPVTFSLRELADEEKSLMAISARKKSLDYRLDFDENIPDYLIGDREKLVRILNNLISNAFKYTLNGSVLLQIHMQEETASAVKLLFSVKDTGIGIRLDDIENLFHAYERIDLLKNNHIEGTGLGLPITDQLLRMMDSRILVDSIYGQGSCFSFELTLPIADTEAAESDTAEKNQKFTAPGARILVVDDDEMNRRLMDVFLNTHGIIADFSENGEDCLKRQENENYHLILMDYMMPGMDGDQVMEVIRRKEEGSGRHTPMIILTADVVGRIERRMMEKGFDDYLSKPVDFSLLEKVLLKFIPQELVAWEQSDVIRTISDRQYQACQELLLDKDIDFGEGLKLVNGDYGQYRRIASFFLECSPSENEKIKAAAETGDLSALRLAMHSLKGRAGSIGAKKLQAEAEELESRCRKMDLEYVRCSLDLVFLQWTRAAEGLQSLLEADHPQASVRPQAQAVNPHADYSFDDLSEELRRHLRLCEGQKARSRAEEMLKSVELLKSEGLLQAEKERNSREILEKIITLIDEMEFDEALEIMDNRLCKTS